MQEDNQQDNTGPITLDFPVTVEGKTYSEIEPRRPKVRDQLIAGKFNGSDGNKEVVMFANLCEVAPSVIEELDMADYGKLQRRYHSFLFSTKETVDAPASQ